MNEGSFGTELIFNSSSHLSFSGVIGGVIHWDMMIDSLHPSLAVAKLVSGFGDVIVLIVALAIVEEPFGAEVAVSWVGRVLVVLNEALVGVTMLGQGGAAIAKTVGVLATSFVTLRLCNFSERHLVLGVLIFLLSLTASIESEDDSLSNSRGAYSLSGVRRLTLSVFCLETSLGRLRVVLGVL